MERSLTHLINSCLIKREKRIEKGYPPYPTGKKIVDIIFVVAAVLVFVRVVRLAAVYSPAY